MSLPRRTFLRALGPGVGTIAILGPVIGQRKSKLHFPDAAKKILIAHRGASAYAPEHTLYSYRLALQQGADFVEQDLQITRDGQLVCLHDLTLERTTNVKDVFPKRYREEMVQGVAARRWFVSDFTLKEIKQLDAGSWFAPKFKGASVPTFQEAIALVRGKAGLYPETKAPEVYGRMGFDMERLLLDSLQKNQLGTPSSERHTPLIVQSFSAASLRKLSSLLPAKLPLVLLVNEEARGEWLTVAGLAEAKKFASGIGPAKALLDRGLVQQAHAHRLTVTPYTFRLSDKGQFRTLADEMSYYLYDLGVDALFTDNPDLFPRTKIGSRP